ncbi:putative glutamyl-tRNA amidotransferase subunit B protein [Rhizobium phage RHph_I1_18]|nr:putative glutamyl-tRNA amidotransferase subunit B protein [Rhizobium phage RHph_I1_18]
MLETLKQAHLNARLKRDATKSSFLGTIIGEVETLSKKDTKKSTDAIAITTLQSFKKRANEILALENISPEQRFLSQTEIEIIDSILPKAPTRVEIFAIVEKLFVDNEDKAKAAMQKPAMKGWFVGQVNQQTNGLADPQIVREAVDNVIGS